ncbi:hypothetical protein [Corynebacterium mastitidis]|uniref:hypothetical protein n=1 Tax=Corynebacterium mastitidis TaxID=161890 RepID=UPI0012EA6948|nr:hypothetical protein [Corynebacterium mastitidis]
MDNPWGNISLKEKVFISEADECVDLKNLWKGKDTRLQLDLPPEPFIGNINTSKLIVLLCNPGFSEEDKAILESPAFLNEYEKCIHSGGRDGGFYYFTPETVDLPGGMWAKRVYNQIINAGISGIFPGVRSFDDLGEGRQREVLDIFYKNIMHIDLFPYRSKASHGRLKGDGECRDSQKKCKADIIPSQEWQFDLAAKAVEKAERGEASIVVVRPVEHWFCNVRSLNDIFGEVSNFIRYTPSRAVRFTKGSLDFQNGKGTFDTIVDRLFS